MFLCASTVEWYHLPASTGVCSSCDIEWLSRGNFSADLSSEADTEDAHSAFLGHEVRGFLFGCLDVPFFMHHCMNGGSPHPLLLAIDIGRVYSTVLLLAVKARTCVACCLHTMSSLVCARQFWVLGVGLVKDHGQTTCLQSVIRSRSMHLRTQHIHSHYSQDYGLCR